MLLLFVLIRVPAVQNFVVGKVISYLEGKIKTPVRIDYVSIDFPKMLVLEGIYFEDQSRDTLLAGEKLRVDVSMLKLLSNTVEVSRIDLQGVTAKINRTLPDSAFNFDYIISAFVTEQEEPTPTDTTAAMKFNIDRVNLGRIGFVDRDEVIGTSAELDLGHLDTRIETFDLTGSMRFGLPRITITELHGVVRQWAVASSSETPDADDFGIPDTADTNLLPVLELQTIDLSDIDFAYVDETGAMDTRFRVDNLLAKLNRLDLNGEVIDIDEIDIEGSRSSISLGQTQPRVDSLATDVAD